MIHRDAARRMAHARATDGCAATACYVWRTWATVAASDRCQARYDAYCAGPPHQRAEIIDGPLYVHRGRRHANARSALCGDRNSAVQRGRGGPGGWWSLIELQRTPLEPVSLEFAGWRVERMSHLPEMAYFTPVPDWVCEVLSGSTEAIDRSKTLPMYAARGVRHVGLLDPVARSLEVYTAADDRRWHDVRVDEGDARVGAEPFAAIELASPRCGRAARLDVGDLPGMCRPGAS